MNLNSNTAFMNTDRKYQRKNRKESSSNTLLWCFAREIQDMCFIHINIEYFQKKKKKQVCTKVTEVFNDYMNYGFSGKSCFGEKELADSYKLHTF